MRPLPLWLLLSFLAVPVLAEHPPLQILSRTPVGKTASRQTDFPVTVTFNQPMVALTSPQEMGDRCFLKITPAVEGRCRWQGTQTLTFEPTKPWPLASGFTVTVAGAKSEVTGRELSREDRWSFTTRPPALLASKPEQGEKWIDLKPTLFLRFNMPMDPRKAREFLSLEENLDGQTQAVELGVRRAKPEEIQAHWRYSYYDTPASTETVLALNLARALKPNGLYRLRLRGGLPAAVGDQGLSDDRVVEFRTWVTFAFAGFENASCLPTDVFVDFTNPVTQGELRKNFRVNPSTTFPALEDYEAKYSHPRHNLPYQAYKPRQSYTFTLGKNLQDIFGNRLGEDKTFSIDMPDFCPAVATSEGVGVLEGYLPARHPVSIVNVPEIEVLRRRVSDNELVDTYQRLIVARGPLDKEGMNTFVWKTAEKPNARLNTFLDMDKALPPGQGGFVFAELNGPDKASRKLRVLDNVTRIGLTLKSSPDSTLVWTTHLRTGAPAKAIPVELRDDDNRVLWQGVTGGDGTAHTPGWIDLGISTWNQYRRPRLWALAKDPKGTAGLSIDWRGGLEPWRMGVNYDWYPRPRTYRGLVFTERGVYRPGETVHIKGLVRRLWKGDWTNADMRRLQLVITDSRDQRVLKTTVTLSEILSSFDADYAIPEAAPTGYWNVLVTEIRRDAETVETQAIYEDEEGAYRDDSREAKLSLYAGFRVEAFKPASFEVTVTPGRDSFFLGEDFQATIDGWYLFGAPMADQPVEWKLSLRRGYHQVPGFEGYDFTGGWWRQDTYESHVLLASAIDALDGKGKKSVDVKLKKDNWSGALVAVLEAGVQSPERQRLFGIKSATVHSANLYVGLKSHGYFQEKGKPWMVDAVAVRPDGAWADGRPLTGKLIRREWLSSRRAGVGNRWEWVTDTRDTVVSTVTWVSAATKTWTFTPEAAGQYFFRAEGVDEEGRAARAEVSFYVTGAGQNWWAQNDTDIIELIPEKQEYKPGDPARILIKSPYPKTRALITVEREGVLDHWVTTLEGGAPSIEVPIKEKHLPNIYVGVVLVQGRTGENKFDENGDDLAKPQMKCGYASLAVSPEGRRLKVTAVTDKSEYRPGGAVTANLKVLDEKGRPVAAEVTLAVVDEGVLALTGFATPDPFSALYGPRPLLVDTADNRLSLIGQRSFGEKGENRGGGGGAGAGLEGIDLRTKFVPTAYWNPKVRTDEMGNAAVNFTLPDNLTRFRVMAVAQDLKRFGSGEARLTVKKPLLMKPSLPRFARIGDEFEGGIAIHNYTDQSAEVLVQASMEGAAISRVGESTRAVTVAAGKAVEVLWSFKAERMGDTKFMFRARAGQETDGLAWTIPVRAPERLDTVATSAVTEKEAVETLRRPADAAPNVGSIDVLLSGTALAGIRGGAQFLLEYPFGCLEQQLSRVMPVVVGADVIDTFQLGKVADLKAMAQASLLKLPSFQHPNGGYGYWFNPWLPDPYITAYALEVAALAKKEGYTLPEDSVSRAVTWLAQYLGDAEDRQWAYPYSLSERYTARAYAVYVLSMHGRPLPNYFQRLFEKRDQLPYSARAFLIKAGRRVGAPPASVDILADELMNQSRVAPTTMHFEEPIPNLCWLPFSNVKTTALTLQAMLDAKGGFPNDERVMRWLTQERKIQGRWRTTHENAAALWAFQDYYRRYEKDPPDFVAMLEREAIGGRDLLWKAVVQGRTTATLSKRFSAATIFAAGDDARLFIRKEGRGRLYYVARYAYAPKGFDKPAAEGFTIERRIKALTGKGTKSGSRSVVTLKVSTPQDRTFVAIEDLLPGGFEVVDPSFAVESQSDAQALAEQSARGQYWGSFQRAENYDDRVAIFADYLTAGDHEYSYLIQATTPGKFHWPSTRVEGMYEPEVFGRTASSDVAIEK